MRQSWRNQSPATRLIRFWLGITWIYGGWDKASDPGFLTPGSATYIGKQIEGFITNSPLSPLLQHTVEHAKLFGLLTMFGEFATGFATLLFVLPRLSAFVGFATSIFLWLTVTYHVKPYFLGSDTAYAVLWGAYLLILLGNNRKISLNADRRGAVKVASTFALVVGAIGLGKVFPKTTTAPTSTNPGSVSGIIKVADLAIGKTLEFKSKTGSPAVLFRTTNGFFAYSRVCTHQGCIVSYDLQSKNLRCPCHGASFDPFNGAKVTAGPAPLPLPKIAVKVTGDWVTEA